MAYYPLLPLTNKQTNKSNSRYYQLIKNKSIIYFFIYILRTLQLYQPCFYQNKMYLYLQYIHTVYKLNDVHLIVVNKNIWQWKYAPRRSALLWCVFVLLSHASVDLHSNKDLQSIEKSSILENHMCTDVIIKPRATDSEAALCRSNANTVLHAMLQLL